MSSSAGTKVTQDPQSFNDPKNENPGVVTSDSLAAESIQGGGSFGANSDARGPSDQPSYSTTTNTTDTSGATQLDPASSAADREVDVQSELDSVSGGQGPTYNTGARSLGSSGISGLTGGSGGDGSGSGSGAGSGSAAASSDSAPSMADDSKPKGSNLQEGGFSSDDPNASFTQDIGGENDPGRAALQNMQERNVPSSGGAGPRQDNVTNDGQYDTLGEASA